MDKNLEILLGSTVDLSQARNEINKFIEEINKNTKIKVNVEANSNLKDIQKQVDDINNSIKKNGNQPKMNDAEAYYQNLLKYVNDYKRGLIDLTTYIDKMQSAMFKNNNYDKQFESMDMSKQLQMVNELNAALRTRQQIEKETKVINDTISKNNEAQEIQKSVSAYNQLLTLTKEQYELENNIKQAVASRQTEYEAELRKQLEINQAKQNSINSNIKDNNLFNAEKEAILLTEINQLKQQGNLIDTQSQDKMRQKNALLQEEFEMYKKTASLNAQNVAKRYGDIGDATKKVNAFVASLDELVVKDGKLVNANTGVETSLKQLRQNFSNIRTEVRNSVTWIDNLKDNLSKFATYLFGGNAIMQGIRGIKEAFSYINEMDKYLTNVQIITGKTAEQVSGLTEEYQKLGQQLGVTSGKIAQIAEDFYRQGRSASETKQLIEATTQMATLSGMGTSESTEYMTSIINGFKVNVNDASDVVSKLVSVDNSAATSVSELAEALSKTSAVANEAGVDLDTLIGYIGTVSETTRQDAGSIGKQNCQYVQKCA